MNRPGALTRSARGPSGWVLVATCIGYGMVILDTTVVNIALPAISRDLGASTSALEWVVDGYSVVFAVCLLSAGALGDRRGARPVFLWGLALFSASSLACGLAPSTLVLIVARLVQGLGGDRRSLVPRAAPGRLSTPGAPRTCSRDVGGNGWRGGRSWAGVGWIAVDALGWRSVCSIDVPLGVVWLFLGRRLWVPRAHPPSAGNHQGLVDEPAQVIGPSWPHGRSR